MITWSSFKTVPNMRATPVLSHFHLGFRVISSEHITDITRLILKDSAELQHCSDTTWGRGLVDHDVGLQNIAISGAICQKDFVPFLWLYPVLLAPRAQKKKNIKMPNAIIIIIIIICSTQSSNPPLSRPISTCPSSNWSYNPWVHVVEGQFPVKDWGLQLDPCFTWKLKATEPNEVGWIDVVPCHTLWYSICNKSMQAKSIQMILIGTQLTNY